MSYPASALMLSLLCLVGAAAIPSANAGGGAGATFPPDLQFLGNLPVVMQGQCFREAPRLMDVLPCELRAGPPVDGGRAILFLIIYSGEEGFHTIMRLGSGEYLLFPFPDP